MQATARFRDARHSMLPGCKYRAGYVIVSRSLFAEVAIALERKLLLG